MALGAAGYRWRSRTSTPWDGGPDPAIRQAGCVASGSALATIEAAAESAASPDDRRTQYVYDAAGRRNASCSRRRIRWDPGPSPRAGQRSFGNPIETRRCDRFVLMPGSPVSTPAQPLAPREQDVAAELAALGYDDAAPASLAGVQRIRQAYDARNRLRFTVDPLGGVTENVHRPLGEPSRRFCYAARPTLALYTEPATSAAVDRGNRANRLQHLVYDCLGQLRFALLVVSPNIDWSDSIGAPSGATTRMVR